MSNLAQLQADKAMRDAARRLVEADLSFVKRDVEDRSLVQRAKDEARETSVHVARSAKNYAGTHPWVVGGGILAILLILLRNPLLDLLIGLLDDRDDDADEDASDTKPGSNASDDRRAEPAAAADRSKNKPNSRAETSR